WGFPVVADSGRIYVFFTREVGIWDASRQGSGTIGCIISDDLGHTWREAPDIPMARSRYDHPDPQVPKNWIVWQKPTRDSGRRWLAGYTLVTSPARFDEPPAGWWHWDSHSYFMRFENIHEGPDPQDIQIAWLPDGDAGLGVPIPVRPGMSAAQEPSIVLLPDARLFATMRTLTGHIWYSVSDDDGETWRKPEPLRYRDGGERIEHPLSCCPIYALDERRYLLLLHNNPGRRLGHDQLELQWRTNHLNFLRNPTFISLGEYRSDAHQPVWFGRPYKLFDTDDVPVGPKGTTEVATYTSMTRWRGRRTLWYPDRKYYLLGKFLTDDLLGAMAAPP
ncbi:MAG: sialidase family protein, partial [Armatimonadota bacterium]